ncbi:MAG: sel1 repeat family protein, partial [Gammaproteobacteria bacterium]
MKQIKQLFALMTICFFGLSYANYQDGWDAYEKGNYQAAIDIWKPLAEDGDTRAQNKLTGMALYGNGYFSGQFDSYEQANRAFIYIKKKAEQGNASSQNNLGVMYDKGKGVPQDYKEAA